MENLTFKELLDLEEKAKAGDKSAQSRLDRMAHEEGYQDWDSLNKELNSETSELLKNVTETIEKEKERRDSTPGMKPLITRLEKLVGSENPVDRAIVGAIPYRNIYAAASKIEEDVAKMPSITDINPDAPTKKKSGRPPLTEAEKEFRKNKVKEADKIIKRERKRGTQMKFIMKKIYEELELSSSTLRDWRKLLE